MSLFSRLASPPPLAPLPPTPLQSFSFAVASPDPVGMLVDGATVTIITAVPGQRVRSLTIPAETMVKFAEAIMQHRVIPIA